MRVNIYLLLVFLFFLFSSCGITRGGARKPPPPPPPVKKHKPTPEEKAEAYYELGVSYIRLGEIPVALNYLFRSAKIKPENAKVYNAIGYAFFVKGDLYNAEVYLRKALSLKKDFSEAYFNLGLIEEKKRHYDQALEYYSKALSNPLYMTPEAAYYRLAVIYNNKGMEGKAIDKLKLAIKNNEDFVPAYLLLAKIFLKRNYIEKSKEIYYKLIQLYPDLQEPYCSLAKIYRDEGSSRLFAKYARKCYEINPYSPLGVRAKMMLEESGEIR